MAAGLLLIVLYALLGLVGIAGLVCFIMVVVEMFKRGETGIGVTCIILAVCTGIGGLVAFVYGWLKAQEWNLKKVMLVWTGTIVVQLVLVAMVVAGAFVFARHASVEQQQHQKQMEEQFLKSFRQLESKSEAESSKEEPADPLDIKIEINP